VNTRSGSESSAVSKTVSALSSLPPHRKKAARELKVNYNNEILPFCSEHKYLGVTLDRSFTYRQHLESLCKKLISRVALLRRLAGSGWVLQQQRCEQPPLPWSIQQ